jgi:hypothetical protein
MAGRYDNPNPELTLSPLSGSMNSATALYKNVTYLEQGGLLYSVHSTKKQLLAAGLRIRIHLIRIQHFRLNTDPDPDPIRIQGFNDHKLKKTNYSWKKN